MPENEIKRWQETLVDRYVPKFDSEWTKIGPRHPKWKDRVKLEIKTFSKYIQFLRTEFEHPWLYLKPETDPKWNFMLWKGYIQVPQRPEIKFEMIIVLSSEYPVIPPRCFLDEKISNYSGKIYLKNNFTDPSTGNNFLMICHDHLGELQDVWSPNLGIAHFFIRQVWFWFAAMQNCIISEWDKKNP